MHYEILHYKKLGRSKMSDEEKEVKFLIYESEDKKRYHLEIQSEFEMDYTEVLSQLERFLNESWQEGYMPAPKGTTLQ